jgi:nucleotide-binding universal stress UspA family protein
MRTLIACTDYTPSGNNACKYAASLAQKLKCKLVLFNIFTVPVVHSNSGLFFITAREQKRHSETKAEKLKALLEKEYKGIKIETFLSSGSFTDEIDTFISKHQIAAVVIGLSTKTKINRFIYGSHSTDIAGRITAPVIVVPDNYKKHKLSNVLLDVDNKEKLHQSSLSDFGGFVKTSKAKLKVLHVRTEDENFSSDVNSVRINDKEQKIEVVKAKDLEEGTKKFCKKNNIDLIALISKKHSIFYDFYSERNTKKLAFASKIPVMAIHE